MYNAFSLLYKCTLCFLFVFCRYESYLARYINFTPGTSKPYCHLSPLPFSMYAMDHLDSIQRRKELGAYKPEFTMINEVHHPMDDYAHFVSTAMQKVCMYICMYIRMY